ncbi:MAG: hypothetical protein J1F18_13195 [Lachnospiraceae bacterium]|nr:hypothetical protein [Lachnospiraceae bacterium]
MEIGISLISIGVAFLSVCVAVYSVRESRKAIITGTYFSEMVDAYADYLKCVFYYKLEHERSDRYILDTALFKLLLYATANIDAEARGLYDFVISGNRSKEELARRINQLSALMRKHIADVQKKGHF